jgi:hypothetical protein
LPCVFCIDLEPIGCARQRPPRTAQKNPFSGLGAWHFAVGKEGHKYQEVGPYKMPLSSNSMRFFQEEVPQDKGAFSRSGLAVCCQHACMIMIPEVHVPDD